MAASSTDNISKPKVLLRYTERAFRGRLYERAALAHCRRRGYRVLKANYRCAGGEIDILAETRDRRRAILIEVRGRASAEVSPSRVFSPRKQVQLRRLATWLALRERRGIAIELVQVTGNISFSPWTRWWWLWFAAWWPELLGLELVSFLLEAE